MTYIVLLIGILYLIIQLISFLEDKGWRICHRSWNNEHINIRIISFDWEKIWHIAALVMYLLLVCSSCRSLKHPTLTKQSQTIIKETLRDSTVTIPADRSSFRAVLETDQAGNSTLKEVLQSSAGKRVRAPQVQLSGGFLQVDCITDSANIYLKWKEKHITDMLKETVYVPTEKELTTWQHVQLWLGRVLLIAIVGGVIIVLLAKKVV